MTFSIEFADEQQEYQARIKVVGCGGSGGNAVNTMINFGLEGVEFIVVNTDVQALNSNCAPTKLNIGATVTKGLGAGADPERGRKAALEDVQRIEAFRKADEVLFQAVKGISDLITQNGIVNVDFADVKTVMASMGRALMGTGIAKGQGRARLAAEMAVASPLLDDISVEGATGVL